MVSNDVPTLFDHLFIKYANHNSLDWKMLKRIAWIESHIGLDSRVAKGISNPKDIEGSKSRDGLSWGIMQSTVATSRDYLPSATPEMLNNPETSIMIGAKHLAFLKRAYPQFSERDIVMAYNHGQGNQLKFLNLEKLGTLNANSYLDGRNYYSKYLKAKELIK